MHKLILGFCIVLLDQASKFWIIKNLSQQDQIDVSFFLKIVHFQNTGAAFSFLHDASGWQNIFFIVLSILILIYLIYLYQGNQNNTYGWFSLILIMSGAIGNIFDRFLIGHVTDFIYLHINNYYWPAFNVADTAISIGAIIYFVGILKKQIK